MSDTPFMPLWVSDFLGDTLDLDATEVGAYMLLLMAQWNRDGRSLPDDQSKLKRVARCGRNWPKVWAEISRFFLTDEDGIYSKRLRLEAQNVAAKRAVNAQSGALGGRAKALKDKERALTNATKTLQRKPSIPEPEPEPEPEKEERANALSKKKPPEPSPFEILTEVVSPEVASDFLAHRKAMRKPVTARAAKLIAKKIRDHPNPDAVLNESIANGWQGVFPERYRPPLQSINGGQHGQAPSKSQLRLDAFVSGAAKTS
jgi:uncharacterized protein YdaU (DUF1376 family)